MEGIEVLGKLISEVGIPSFIVVAITFFAFKCIPLLKANNDKLVEAITKVATSVNDVRADVNDIRADVNEVRADVVSVKNDVSFVKNKVDELDDKVDNIIRKE